MAAGLPINGLFRSGDLSSEQVASKARESTPTVVFELAERLDKLTLISWAMWTLLREHNPAITEEDLMQRVRDLDLLDGTADGKITKLIARCSKCNRVMSQRHTKCLYCGAEKLIVTAFDTL